MVYALIFSSKRFVCSYWAYNIRITLISKKKDFSKVKYTYFAIKILLYNLFMLGDITNCYLFSGGEAHGGSYYTEGFSLSKRNTTGMRGWLNNVTCVGGESHLHQCDHAGWGGPTDCDTNQDLAGCQCHLPGTTGVYVDILTDKWNTRLNARLLFFKASFDETAMGKLCLG